jgi:hypothetical protein
MGDANHLSPAHRLFSRVRYQSGVTIVRFPDGSFRQFQYVDQSEYPDGSGVWIGGRSHVVTDDVAGELESAGYGQFLTPEGA